MALGAQRKEVLETALGRAIKLLAFGSAAGLLLGILASHVLASVVYRATPRDPLALAGAVLAIGLLATWIPAQRALSIDPVILLREEWTTAAQARIGSPTRKMKTARLQLRSRSVVTGHSIYRGGLDSIFRVPGG